MSAGTGSLAETVKSYIPGTEANKEARYEQGRDTGHDSSYTGSGNQTHGSGTANQGYGGNTGSGNICCSTYTAAVRCAAMSGQFLCSHELLVLHNCLHYLHNAAVKDAAKQNAVLSLVIKLRIFTGSHRRAALINPHREMNWL